MAVYTSSQKGFTIEIDYARNELLTEGSKRALDDGYLLKNENYQEAFARAACAYGDNQGHAQRLYDYASNLWFMFATPVLANGGNDRGLPISCFLSYVDDSCDGLIHTNMENSWISVRGGGLSSYYGTVRSVGEITSKGNETPGVLPFIKTLDSIIGAFKQGNTRRGAGAVYLDISHPEIIEFLQFRRTDKGLPPTHQMQNLHNAVNIPDAFMKAVETGSEWELIDPKSKKVKSVVKARELWAELLTTRMMTGEPYFHFIDTSNRLMPDALKMKGLRINSSNLCNEIYLPTNNDRTAVCCLSSVNCEKYEDWKDEPLFIEDLIRMLDNVLEDFIKRAPTYLSRAVKSAMHERSLGLGMFGWHYFLQSKNIPWESVTALSWLRKIHGYIYHNAKAASGKLAQERGEALDMRGTGLRNAHVIAIAPNASIADISGSTSESVFPIMNNYFIKNTKYGQVTWQNRYLKKKLAELGKDNYDIWKSIRLNEGSVQHLTFLDNQTKDVFKTAFELDQMWVIEQAAVRQEFIDQGQSLNLFFPPNTGLKELAKVHKAAWMKGLKGLYYLRSDTTAKVDTLGMNKPTIEKQQQAEPDECLACGG